jgi:sn-1 stearoyl-lipid 9-desaturase
MVITGNTNDQEKRTNGKFDITTFVAILLFHLLSLLCFVCFSWLNFGVLLILQFITGIGITLGFHRLFTHKSFVVKNNWLKFLICLAGSLSLQGDVISWIVDHYQHHNHSDKPQDAHSSREGFWWCHMGWLFTEFPDNPQQQKLRATLEKDPILLFFSKPIVYVGIQVILGYVLLQFLGFGALIYGVFLRTVVVWHITWFINSACHLWGDQPFPESGDYSKNLWWMAILANGEGWHNNHHMYQSSPKHGLEWYQIDVTWYIIKVLQVLKLVDINPKLIP